MTRREHMHQIRPTLLGWCSVEKADRIFDLIVDNQLEVLVEIGVFGGSSLIPQGLALAELGKGIVYGIDPWTNDAALDGMIAQEHRDWWAKVDLAGAKQSCQTAIDACGLSNLCELIQAKAADVVDRFEDNSVDLLHIDGNHSEHHAYEDASLYLPKVRPGGWVLIDDIAWSERPGVIETSKAQIFLLNQCQKIDIVNGDCMLLRKSGS